MVVRESIHTNYEKIHQNRTRKCFIGAMVLINVVHT